MLLNIRKHPLALLLLTSLVFSGCQKDNSQRSVNHIVLLWFKNDADKDIVSRVMIESLKLGEIKEVKNLHIGRPVPSERSIVDSSFDLGISMKFESKDAMERYLKDPRHTELFKKYIEKSTSKVIVYDF